MIYFLNCFFIFVIFSPFSFSESFSVATDNKELLNSLKKTFNNKAVFNSDLQKFLLENSYYSSELIQKNGDTIIKNPYKIIFVFKGNHFFKKKELKKFIKIDETKLGAFFHVFIEKEIKRIYQEEGFLKVKIDKTETKAGWKKWIFFNISEGPRVYIGELKVKGLLSQSPSKYENFIIENSTERIKIDVYNKKDLEKGYKNLINHLKSEGYLQSKIYSDRVFFKDNKAFITINLEEGPLTLIKDIQIKNEKLVPVWEILSHMESRIQSPLKVDTVQKDLKRIEDLYKSKGYMEIKIMNREDVIKYIPGNRYANIFIEINEGPKAFISKISFIGLKKAKTELIESLLKFKTGDILTPLKKEKSLQALGETGLFSNISLEEQMQNKALEITGIFKERSLRSLRGGVGINSQRGLTTRAWTELTHRNLFGWGRALVAKGISQVNLTQEQAFFEYEFSGRYKEVFIPKYGYQGDVNLSHARSLFNPSEKNNNFIKKTQLQFFINKKLSERLNLEWNVFSFESRKSACIQNNCPSKPQQIVSTNAKVYFDKRDNIFDPSKGYLSSWLVEWADPHLGGDKEIAFIKTDIKSSFYWSFLENYTLALTLKGGIISTIQNSQYIPVSRSFILGGQTSLRGYDGHIEGERIPRKRYAPINTANEALRLKKEKLEEHVINSQYGLVKINFRFPIFKELKGLVFYDFGAVYLKSLSQSLLDYGHSVGLGLRYQIFLIPVGLDIAFQLPPKECIQLGNNKSKEDNCAYSRLHFSIGW